MEALLTWLRKNVNKALGSATAIAGGQFGLNLILALRDGKIEPDEWNKLLTSASGLEFVLLGGIMIVMAVKK